MTTPTTTPNEVMLRMTLRDALIELKDARAAFGRAMRADSGLPAWSALGVPGVEGAPRPDAVREHFLQVIGAFSYQDGQDPRGSVICPGLCACSEATLAAGERLNRAKADFQAAVKALRQARLAMLSDNPDLDPDLRADAFRKLGLSRVHLVQVYRQLKILPIAPLRVGLTWARGTASIVRISRDEAWRKLDTLGDRPEAGEARTALESLRADAQLAQARPVSPHVRANLTWPADADAGLPRQVHLSLPLLFPGAPGQPLPEHNRLSPEPPPPGLRLPRNDRRLSEEPLIASLGIYAYIGGAS